MRCPSNVDGTPNINGRVVVINNYGVNGPLHDPTRKPNTILSEAELFPPSDIIEAGMEFEYININNFKKSRIVFNV